MAKLIREIKWFFFGYGLPFVAILALDLAMSRSRMPPLQRLLGFLSSKTVALTESASFFLSSLISRRCSAGGFGARGFASKQVAA
jgi:hypothetical protein